MSDLTLPLAYGEDASAGANHTRSSAVWLTCARPETGATPRLGMSVDQVAAQSFGQDTPLPSLELSLEEGGLSGGSGLSGAYRNTIAWRTPTAPLPMEVNPQVVFERLFGDGATAEQRAQRRAQAASLLDSVLDGRGARSARTLPGDDRARLERHLEDVREVERRIELAGRQGRRRSRRARQARRRARRLRAAREADVRFARARLGRRSHARRHADDREGSQQRRVSRERHQRPVPQPVAPLRSHSEHRALRSPERLSHEHDARVFPRASCTTTPDGDGTLLDHSLVLYGSGMSNSNQHDHEPLPTIVAGGASGALAGGRHIRAGAGTPFANLLVALLDKLGVGVESFGDSTGAVAL